MTCDRCGKSGVLKDVFKPDGKKMALCTECRKEIDAGATFEKKEQPAPKSKWARQMEKEDRGETKVHVDATGEKYRIANIQPFPASWRRK